MGSSENTGAAAGVVPRLKAARERLDAKDLAAAAAIYEEVLATAGERADVLVTISGDLGSTGHVGKLIELIAPRYDAARHGPATGFNLLQAYIGVRDPESAQHVLDLLFALNRRDLEERLFGFSNAISELHLTGGTGEMMRPPSESEAETAPSDGPKVGVVTISKPVWFYGLEPLADRILPPKEGKLRKVAFAQLALPGLPPELFEPGKAGNELTLLAGAIPAWFAEIFTFCPVYAPVVAVAFVEQPDGSRQPMHFSAEWTTENLRNLVDTTTGGLDYIVTGALRHRSGDYELTLRLWEVRKFRERKQFSFRWTPSNVDAELGRLREQVCVFMEWAAYPAGLGLPYVRPQSSRDWLEVIGASLQLFMVEKKLVPPASVVPLAAARQVLDRTAPGAVVPALAWITLQQRATAAGVPLPPGAPELMADPLVEAAQNASGDR